MPGFQTQLQLDMFSGISASLSQLCKELEEACEEGKDNEYSCRYVYVPWISTCLLYSDQYCNFMRKKITL
jgi:hypothetical protein